MPYKRAGSPFWWISYTDASGRRTRESTGTTSKKEAVALESRARLESHKQQQWGDSPRRTFDELLLKYLQEFSDKKSHDRDLYSAKRLNPFFTGRYLDEITPADINEYKQARAVAGVKPGTVIKELRLFSTALNTARKVWDWDVENVVAGRAPKAPPGKLRWLTRGEYAVLIESAGKNKRAPYIADFIRLGVATGMRRGELLGLEWARVDFASALVYLQPEDAKSGGFESVPLNATALEILRKRKESAGRYVFEYRGEPIESVKKSLATAASDAGLVGVTAHTLRHTCAAWLVQAGVPLRTVRDILRHKDIKTTMIYAHLSPENVREGVAMLDGSL